MWVTTQTQPDVVFDVCQMSFQNLLLELNNALQKLKSRTGSIIFPQLGRPSDLNIVYYAYATYASFEDERL